MIREIIKESLKEDSGLTNIPVLGANPSMKQLYSSVSGNIARAIENGHSPDEAKGIERFSNNSSSKLDKIYGVYTYKDNYFDIVDTTESGYKKMGSKYAISPSSEHIAQVNLKKYGR